MEKRIVLTRKMQGIIDAINHDRQGLLSAVAGLSEAQLDHRPAEGQWSISDILHHLALVEEANQRLFGMMLGKAAENSAPPDAAPDASVLDCADPFRNALVNPDNKVTAPERVRPLAPLSAREGLARLAAAREKTTEAAGQLGRYDLSHLKWPHPVLGELNLYQWFVVVGLHERRHTTQINRIKANPDFPRQ